MSFATLLQLNAYGMATGPGSESVTFRLAPGFASTTKTAVVNRKPISDVGELLANTVEIWIDKNQLPSVTREEDLVVVDSDEYTIVGDEDFRGGWLLRAVR